MNSPSLDQPAVTEPVAVREAHAAVITQKRWLRVRSISAISLVHGCRALLLFFLLLALLSHSNGWQQGPFTWGAPMVPGMPWQIGPLSLLPLLVLGGLAALWWMARPQASWSWGSLRLTLPFLGITLLALPDIVGMRLVTAVLMLTLFWLVYLGLINLCATRASWTGFIFVLVAVIIIQAGVGIIQFGLQHDLGLTWLGEMALDPAQRGISVVMNGDARWLRAYGLNSHPNRLGWKLVLLLLMLWPYRTAVAGWQRGMVWAAFGVGLAGLAVTLSRSAWLALAVGAGIYGLAEGLSWWQGSSWRWPSRAFLALSGVLSGSLGLFAINYRRILHARLTRPTTGTELMPVFERVRDIHLSRQLFLANPWQGVGLGRFTTMATEINPFAGLVHVVPLLVGVELGLMGLVGWMLILVAPLVRLDLLRHYAPQTAVWLAMFTISMLQPEPTLFTMQGTIMLAVVAAMWSAIPES